MPSPSARQHRSLPINGLAPAIAAAAIAALGGNPVAARDLPSDSHLEASRSIIPGKPQQGLRVTSLVIRTAKGAPHRYRVEIAATPDEQAHGMMFRTTVPEGTGMLFPFAPPRPVSFWMKNTLVALDIIFIDANGRVLNIAANAVPQSETALPSKGAAAAVLELAGGEALRIGLAPGDHIDW